MLIECGSDDVEGMEASLLTLFYHLDLENLTASLTVFFAKIIRSKCDME